MANALFLFPAVIIVTLESAVWAEIGSGVGLRYQSLLEPTEEVRYLGVKLLSHCSSGQREQTSISVPFADTHRPNCRQFRGSMGSAG